MHKPYTYNSIRLVLRCIDADFCVQGVMFSHFSRSRRSTLLRTAPNSKFQHFQQILIFFRQNSGTLPLCEAIGLYLHSDAFSPHVSARCRGCFLAWSPRGTGCLWPAGYPRRIFVRLSLSFGVISARHPPLSVQKQKETFQQATASLGTVTQ